MLDTRQDIAVVFGHALLLGRNGKKKMGHCGGCEQEIGNRPFHSCLGRSKAMNAARTHGPIRVEGGTWAGQIIRRARKAGRCDYSRGIKDGRPASENGRCPNRINIGDHYMTGEMNDNAGGYGCDRYCMQCAGQEARAALSKAES